MRNHKRSTGCVFQSPFDEGNKNVGVWNKGKTVSTLTHSALNAIMLPMARNLDIR